MTNNIVDPNSGPLPEPTPAPAESRSQDVSPKAEDVKSPLPKPTPVPAESRFQDVPPEDDGEPGPLSAGLASSKKPAIIAIIVNVVVLIIMIIVAVFLYNNPDVAETVRDIGIIFLSLQALLISVLLVALLVVMIYVSLKLYDLADFVRTELAPMLRNLDDTVRTVRSRTTYIGDTAVKPVIEATSYVAYARSIVKSFTRIVK